MDEARPTRSISQWIEGLKQGDDQAAHRLYQLYFHRIVGLARTHMTDRARRVADEQNVAASAFQSLCVGIEAGRFDQLQHQEDFWKLLVTITLRKTAFHLRRWTHSPDASWTSLPRCWLLSSHSERTCRISGNEF